MRSLFADALTSTLLISGETYYTDIEPKNGVSDFDLRASLLFYKFSEIRMVVFATFSKEKAISQKLERKKNSEKEFLNSTHLQAPCQFSRKLVAYLARINSPNFACALKIEFEKKRFLHFWELGIVYTMAFPIRDFDPITCNQLIRPVIDCRRKVRVKYNKQTRAAEYSLSIDLLLLLNREIFFFCITDLDGGSFN